MQVKNIKLFRAWLKRQEKMIDRDENFIGYSNTGTSTDDPNEIRGFFNVFHANSPNIGDRLSTVLDMAQDSQAIYEFVQNAVDCDSTKFFMFYSDGHFLAINNGRPFDLAGIRAILNFAQSTKTKGENIGKFGVGFKLIHRMVGAGNGLQELLEEYTGPIIFSWSEKAQFKNFLAVNSTKDIQTKNDEDWGANDTPWLFKILLTCVPILPSNLDSGIKDICYKDNDTLFTEDEFQSFKTFLNDVWRKNQDKLKEDSLNQGSLFYLRLGQDKQKQLDEDYTYFRKGIQHSLSFVSNLMSKKGLEEIFINNYEPIIKDNIDVSLEKFIFYKNSAEFLEIRDVLKENDKNQDINIVLGFQKFENNKHYGNLRQSPNFYKFFPMGKEVCGLNFIVHCNIFEIEASRREFVQQDKRNIFILQKLSNKFIERCEEYKKTNKDTFNDLFLAVLFSNESHYAQWQWISNVLYKPLTDYISKNCPTIGNEEYHPATSVVIKNTDLNVTPKDFGIAGKFWFKWAKKDFDSIKSSDGAKDLTYTKIIKQAWSVIHLIKEGNVTSIKSWYSNADVKTKELFCSELESNWSTEIDPKFWNKISEIPELIDSIIKSNDNRVKANYIRSLNSLKLPINKIYSIDSYEFKLLKIAVESITQTNEIEAFRSKVILVDINGEEHKLNEARDNDKITFGVPNGATYELSLSLVLPDYLNKSGLLSMVIDQFDKLELPLNKFLGVGRQKSVVDVMRSLNNNHQKITNEFQFAFLALFSAENKSDFFQYFNLEGVKAKNILDFYFNNKFPFPVGYEKYIIGPSANQPEANTSPWIPQLSFWPDAYCLESELPPEPVKLWLSDGGNSEAKIQFLSTKAGINTSDSDIVKIRKALIGIGEVTQHQFDLVSLKNNQLLLNTLIWLKGKSVCIRTESQISLIQKLLKTFYAKEKFSPTHPQLYISEVKSGNIPEYKFLNHQEQPLSIDQIKMNELALAEVSLQQIFEVAKKGGKYIFDFRLYPENDLPKSIWEPIIITTTPDFQKIYNHSWSFDMNYFVSWEYNESVNVRFYDGPLPHQTIFQKEVLRKFNQGNSCKDDSNGFIYINLNSSLDNLTKSGLIMEYIKSLPDTFLSYHKKNSLDIAYKNWLVGEYTNVEKIRKDRVKNSTEFSFEWLKNIFDWEYDASMGNHSYLNIKFERVELNNGRILLSDCNYETIPPRVEYTPNPISLMLRSKAGKRTVVCNIVNYKEFELTLAPNEQVDISFFETVGSLSGYKASFRLTAEDLLMSSLRDNLFGANGIAPKNGSIANYFESIFHEKKIAFLFGPPGTGKTTKLAMDVLLTLCDNHRQGNKTRILILTPTNKSADVVIERIITLLLDPYNLEKVASSYYSEATLLNLIEYCRTIIASNSYRQIFMRYGNTISQLLCSHNVVQSNYTVPEVPINFVLATTIHRLPFDSLGNISLKDPLMNWSHVVMDEASMISLPHAVFALLQFKTLNDPTNKEGLQSTFTIAGDPFQIQPVGQTPNYIEQGIEGLKGWATENIYKLFELSNFSQTRTPKGNFLVYKLNTQYRSVPSIGEVFSRYKYDGQIKHQKTETKEKLRLGYNIIKPISLIHFPVFENDTQTEEEVYNIQKYGPFSAYHIHSIVLACELASAIKLQNPQKTICILTPYGTQARLAKEISNVFKNQNHVNHYEVSTIHRYQGDESDVVLLLMNPPKTSPFEYSHFNNPYLINVGISRAKEALIILHPGNASGYSEIMSGVTPQCNDINTYNSAEIESILFGQSESTPIKRIVDLVEVSGFQTFNVCNLNEFMTSGKEYLFFADNRDLNDDESRFVNVIVNLSKRLPLVNFLKPEIGMIVSGIVTQIHANGKIAIVDIRNLKEQGSIHSNFTSSQFVSDINQVLQLNQVITAKILQTDQEKVWLSMIDVEQEKVH